MSTSTSFGGSAGKDEAAYLDGGEDSQASKYSGYKRGCGDNKRYL